jgi:hypothetical protein
MVIMIVLREDFLLPILYLLHHKHGLYLKEDSIHQMLELNDHFEEDQLVPAMKNKFIYKK